MLNALLALAPLSTESPLSLSYVGPQTPALRTVANACSGASQFRVTVTVTVWPGLGRAGVSVALIVPPGERKLTTCVIGLETVNSSLASQMQNISGPGESHVTASD